MASSAAEDPHECIAAPEQRLAVTNKHGESLVGVLHNVGWKKVVVICHAFAAFRDDSIFHDLVAALTNKGFSVFRFDFGGNREREGEFQYGNYRKEADDLHSIITYLKEKYDVTAIVGHRRGGNVVATYASVYDDVHTFVIISGLFDLDKGIEDCKGTMSMSKAIRFMIIHGSADEFIPVENAYKYAKLMPSQKLEVIMGANHEYTSHRKEIADAVTNFMTSSEESRHPYERWTLKQLLEESRRLRSLGNSFSSVLRHDNAQADQTSSLLPHATSPASASGQLGVLQQRTPPRHYRRTVSSQSPSFDRTPPSDLPEWPHNLGKRLEEVLISLRDVAFELARQGLENEVSGILDAGLSIVASFCDAIRIPEAYKAIAISENTKVTIPKLDPEYNLLYLQMKAAIEMQQEGALQHELLFLSKCDDCMRCPLSHKNMIDIWYPVRSVTCGHIYEHSEIMSYVGSCIKECPVTGCPGVVSADLVFQDAELRRDIRTATHKRMGRGAGQDDVTKRLYIRSLVTT